MPQKTLVLSGDPLPKYVVIHPTAPPYPVEAEEQQVKEILKKAEDSLKEVFDKSGPSLVSGVKIGIAHLF